MAFGGMSCDYELANEWVRCSGRNASYITIQFDVHTTHGIFHWRLLQDNRWLTKSNVTTFLTKKAAFVVSVHFELSLQSSVCILDLDRILYHFCSFVLGLQSAFCTDRMTGFYSEVAREFILKMKPNSTAKYMKRKGHVLHTKGHVSHTTTT